MVWIDCEMTGLDPKFDELVEVAVVITDSELNVVDPGMDVVIKPSQAALAHMDDFVTNMHTESGLIDELEAGLSLGEAEQQVLDYIKRFVPEPRVASLAGNSVGQDKLFLLEYMPEVAQHLHYRVIDVSTIKELAKRWYPRVYACAPEKHGGHRALADILESIQELVYYRKALFPAELNPQSGFYKTVAQEVEELGIAVSTDDI
ncbi:oligoribonuclease [Actinomycetaceae bacterium WB03_NA08]|uniref:Oligoribonuclease n=1 Tax=Scrofimicrobium canadense TaxID=2652290 RepID=A0A6N7W6M9_9ACTO|nr:oligoribonuclease [Scrofimicrobium canadense]MSS84925.1 oligoribonuclease [Scrofimicrobium canadense]